MKKLMLMLAMGTFCSANVQATSSPLLIHMVEQAYQNDKVEIDEADLPQAVQDAIQNDREVKDLEIDQVYQITKGNQLFYEITFEEGSFDEKLTRKYDAAGQEMGKGVIDSEDFHKET
ncbi:MAG: hypothetical protein WD426_14785 [Anditalea sp.]